MALYQSLIVAYAKAIYVDGTKNFSQIRPEYIEPVKQYAADKFTRDQMDAALAKGYINQQEYDDTVALLTI